MARQSSNQTQVYSMKDWSGGLNFSTPMHLLQPNELSDANYVFIDKTGGIRTADYRVQITATNAKISGTRPMIYDIVQANSKLILLAIDNPDTKTYVTDTDAPASITSITEVTGTSPAYFDETLKMKIYNKAGTDYVFFCDRDTATNYWTTGTTRTAVTGGKIGFAMEIKDDRLFQAGDTTAPARLFFSEPGIWDTLPAVKFPASNYIDIPDGRRIGDIQVFRDILYIFTEYDIWALYGNSVSTYELRKVVSGVGGAWALSGVTTRVGIFFAGYDGFYLFDGNTTHNLTSKKSIIRDYVLTGRNWNIYANQIREKVYFTRYRINGDSAPQVFVYDWEKNAWTMFVGAATDIDQHFVCWKDIVKSAEIFQMSGSGAVAGVCRLAYSNLTTENSASEGDQQTPYFATAPIDFGTQNPKLLRALKFIGFWYNKTVANFTITIYLDNEDTSYAVLAANTTINGAGTTDFDSLHEIYMGLPAGLIARNFRVKMQYNSLPMRVKQIDWHYQTLPDRKIDW